MSAGVTIGPLRRRHLRAVLAIERAGAARPWTESLFLSELALPVSRVYLVARAERKVVGYAGMMFAPDEGHITTIAVHPQHRRRGVATQLLVALARTAIERDYGALTLEVRAGAEGAQALYRTFGFTVEGVRAGYYTEPPEDAVIMWARDLRGPEYARRLEALAARSERVEESP
jgi:ribosomal-protein-alanine N-acetyltransferase